MSMLPISQDSCLCLPFCDYVNITTPTDNASSLLSELMPFLDAIGAVQVLEGLFLIGNKGGAFKLYEKGGVSVFSMSGGILESLRANKMLEDVLFVFGGYPHNVSMLHATVDYAVHSPKFLAKIYSMANDGEIKLSRKALSRKNITKIFGMDDEGNDTGTLYLGDKKNSDIWAKVYDKRKERMDKGFDDPGYMLRLEMAYQTDVGATLKDVFNPHDIFYQYAQKSLVRSPKGFKGWVSYATPYELNRPKRDLTTWQRIKGIVENSTDITRIFELAVADYGPDAEKEILTIIKNNLVQRMGRNP